MIDAAKLCECGCGNQVRESLRFIHGHNGKVTNRVHGLSGKRGTYRSWDAMKQRCTNPKNNSYRWYGANGVKLCERWMSFENFIEDMGECPKRMSLDRYPDNNGNYEKGNCRWATAGQQSNNRRNNSRLSFNGEILTISEWGKRTGINRGTIRDRIEKGWEIEKALTTPPRNSRSTRSHR